MICVVDASVALSWSLPDEGNETTFALLKDLESESAVAPAVWPLELANALLVAERRKRVTFAQANKALTMLLNLPIDICLPPRDMEIRQIISLARTYRLSTYDAAYLELALRLSLPLATLDNHLQQAAKQAGVEAIF